MSSEALASIRQAFFEECADHLGEFEAGLIALDAGERDPDIVNAVFRAAHSIKGGAAIFGIDVLARCAHAAETVLSGMRDSGEVPPLAISTLLRAVDILADLTAAAREERTLDEVTVNGIVSDLESIADRPAATAEIPDDDFGDGFEFTPVAVTLAPLEGVTNWTIIFRPHASLYGTANEPLFLLDQLAALGDCFFEADLSEVPLLDALDPRGAYVRWRIVIATTADQTELRSLFDFIERDCDLSIAPSGQEETAAASPEPAWPAGAREEAAQPQTIRPQADGNRSVSPAATMLRVDVDRVDRLIDLMSELVTSEAVLTECATVIRGPEGTALTAAIEDLKSLTRALEENVMAIRSQALGPVFQRMSRLVRETEARTGKRARLIVEGEDTEVDRGLIEGLTDPLTHMIRNSIDHGLELPEERVRLGKPAAGEIRVSAAHRGGRVVIEVSDDGAGINLSRVRQTAIARGIVTAEQELAPHEIENLIFEPGLSTAEAVSDVSGRGVGMDVVRKRVQALGGRITVRSRPGIGTTFVLSLPLTLAVLDGMLVVVDGERMIVPLNAVLESIKPQPSEIHTIGPQASLLSIRGEQVPYLDLASTLGYGNDPVKMDTGIALLLESDAAEPVAFRVDEIVDTRQVVIKSLEANYQAVSGIAAATILGDGKVALILDVNALIESRRQRTVTAERLVANA
jgi:two-component system chemotaxis sensor kinase CheA